MAHDKELQAALTRIEQISRKRPEWHILVKINERLVRSLFTTTIENSWQPDLSEFFCSVQPGFVAGTKADHGRFASLSECAKKSLSEGTPLLRERNLGLDPVFLRSSWMKVCESIEAIEQTAQRFAAAVDSDALNLVTVLNEVLAGRPERSEQQFTHLGLDPSLGFTILRLSCFPLLAFVAEQINPLLSGAEWNSGYCPICGNGPLLAELRGLEQLRWLRCGWCAGEWQVDRLYCPSCDNRDHRQLHELLIEGEEEAYRLSMCDVCGSSMPTISTLGRLSAPGLLVAEMEIVHLRLIDTANLRTGSDLDTHAHGKLWPVSDRATSVDRRSP